MSIKHKIKLKSYRDRGTSSAVLRSSGPKHSAERPATTLGVEGESIRRDVPDNDNVFKDDSYDNEYRSGGAYKALLKLFNEHIEDVKYADHCKRFFKGDNE